MQVKITKWGNSQGIRLSKSMLASIGMTNPVGQRLEISVKKDKIVIEKVPSMSKLAERFKNFDSDCYRESNRDTKAFDWGINAGKELL